MGRETCRIGLIGAGIEASLSPALHEREAAALGIDYSYELLDIDELGVAPEAAGELVERARRAGFGGLNVTHPCKQLVLPAMDELSSHAATLGAVNTVVFDGDRAVGHNTDWPGFAASFARGLPGAPTRRVVLVGAGGAGSAVAHALGADELVVVDADRERGEELAAGVDGARAAAPGELGAALAKADGLVHATPTGMAAHPGTAVDPDLLDPRLWVAEVVYRPLETQLVHDARARGCRTLDGGGMAVFQAAGSFELFTGRQPDAERMLRHLAELEEVGAVRRAIATVSLSGSLEEKLEAAARAGFDGIELFENDLIASPLRPGQVRRRASELGLEIALYQPLRDLEAVPEATFRANLRRAEHKLGVMEELGADTILVCSSVAPEAVDDDALAAEQLARFADLAVGRGMRVAYEALAWGRHVCTYVHAWRIVRAAAHPALGLCLDSFHVLSRGSDPLGIREIPGERIFFLQLADAPVLRMDVLQWSRHHRCFPWQGAFDLAGFTAHVLAAGYDGPLSLEVFNDVFRQADPDRMALDAMRSLLLLEEALGRADVPAPPELRGHAFVELGVPAGDAAGLADTLAAIGFEQVGPHRSKPVALWRDGAARVVLNHGEGRAAVTALALQSADPERSAARAEALGAPVLPRRRGPDEAELHAFLAPDGTQVFVTEADDWVEDFVALGDGGRRAHGLLGIDHVGLSQPFELFDEAALFHRAVLGLRGGEGHDLASPDGLLHSRAMADPSGRVRLALTIPRLGGGLPGALTELQHVAFACDDVLARAAGLRERGAPLLAIPDNYYDDLAARLELDDGLLARLQGLGVLYDRDAHGEFLHVFTTTVGGRLFFELVQRVGGYEGYGAVNSAVRLAAQRRAATAAGAV